MDESARLYQPLLSPEEWVRKYRYNPFRRGRYIRALKESICHNELPENISHELLSVINDCLFPGDIEAILTQHASHPCLLATLIAQEIDLREYPAIQKVADKYKNGELLLHLAIEQRDVEAFRAQLNENNLTRPHPQLKVLPIDHLRHLIEQYKNNRGFKTPRQWWRNRKLQQMLEIYQTKMLSSAGLVSEGESSDEEELTALNLSYAKVLTPDNKPENFSEEWMVNLFKKNSEVVDKLLARCMEKKDGWKVLFNAALNFALELKEEQREHLLETVLAELDFLADRAESMSHLIKEFSTLYQDAREIEANEALLEKAFDAVKPQHLMEKMKKYVKIVVHSPPQSSLN